MINDKKNVWTLADLTTILNEKEDSIWEKYMEWWNCPNNKQSKELYLEYLEMLHDRDKHIEKIRSFIRKGY